MPSLRQRVSSYFRQLSFHNEPRDKKHNINENTFITKYLQGQISLREGPAIIYGKNPTDLPNYELGQYEPGYSSIIGCYSGPNGGLTTVKRREKHLSVLDPDIDFIDTATQELDEPAVQAAKKSPQRRKGQPVDNTTMVIKVAGQEYCVTNRTKKHNKSHSLGSISDFDLEIETTRIDREFYKDRSKTDDDKNINNNNSAEVSCKNSAKLTDTVNNMIDKKTDSCDMTNISKDGARNSNDKTNYALAKSKSDGNPFRHQKRGKIIKVAQRPVSTRDGGSTEAEEGACIIVDDSALPREWNRKSDLIYGISDSLYDRNQVTRNKNGDPIADCFGVISRNDSAILAVADGVNWGEKASVAAKSAVHGCLHYLNKTIFNDIKPFENLTVKSDDSAEGYSCETPLNTHRVANTREIFVCLLRAFNCAHDLILENQGMLTTLTVAVVLPLKPRIRRDSMEEGAGDKKKETQTHYVCCVCNVGDTLAYVYSQKYGLRELTRGSHDINCNRDMRDALGALGPVDGINPELSNLTLSITTLQRGDIVMVASDGLTDNFDPHVCRFTVNTNATDSPNVRKARRPKPAPQAQAQSQPQPPSQKPDSHQRTAVQNKPPVKPPRRSHANKSTSSRAGSVTSDSSSTSDRNSRASSVVSDNVAEVATDLDPLKAHFVKENPIDRKKPTVVETKTSSLRRQATSQNRPPAPSSRKILSSKKSDTAPSQQGYKFLRSKTTIEVRSSMVGALKQILRNEDGIPYVTPLQRYELQLLLIEDVLRNGISGRDSPCSTARKLCENLVNFTFSITSAKRHTLEDQELYFDNRNGVMVEVSQQEKKIRRKKGLEKVNVLPGKLDHVSVVAWNVGNVNV